MGKQPTPVAIENVTGKVNNVDALVKLERLNFDEILNVMFKVLQDREVSKKLATFIVVL